MYSTEPLPPPKSYPPPLLISQIVLLQKISIPLTDGSFFFWWTLNSTGNGKKLTSYFPWTEIFNWLLRPSLLPQNFQWPSLGGMDIFWNETLLPVEGFYFPVLDFSLPPHHSLLWVCSSVQNNNESLNPVPRNTVCNTLKTD